MSTPQERRDYQRRYYQTHKDKAKEYQRAYNLAHKKNVSGRGKKHPLQINLLKDRSCFTPTDLMNITDRAFERACRQILSGQARVIGLGHKRKEDGCLALSQ